jgi:hypothetical protein
MNIRKKNVSSNIVVELHFLTLETDQFLF